MEALGHRSGQARQPRPDARDRDRDRVRPVGRPGPRQRVGGEWRRGEERCHEREMEDLPLVAEWCAVLPGRPGRPDRPDPLAQPRHRRRPDHPEAPLDVPAHLRPQPQPEPPARQARQVEGGLRQDGRAPREGDRDRRAELDPIGRRRGERDRREGVVVGLGDPEPIEAEPLGRPRHARRLQRVEAADGEIDLHRGRSSQKPRPARVAGGSR